jgi:putative ABC transport system permease protein
MKILRQALAISVLNLRSLPRRKAASIVLVCGIAGVVLVVVSLLSMAKGLEATLRNSGRPDRALMLRAGSNSELNGSITREQLRIVADKDGIAMNEAGKPLISGEIYTSMFLPRRGGRPDANLPLRGVSDMSFGVRREVRVVEGRKLDSGKFEMLVGRRAAREFAGIAVGDSVSVRGTRWQIVGVFEADGAAFESEAWADVSVLGEAFKRGEFLSVIVATLRSSADLDVLRASIARDPRLPVQVLRESEYYARQAASSTNGMKLIGLIIGAIMAIGAALSALNTMYAAVSARTGEIATLKALGFTGFPIVASVMIEAALLALSGGVLGAALSWGLFDGYNASTVGATFAQVAFEFSVTPDLIASGIAFACLVGAVGGLLPAIRASRLSVVMGLRG